MRDHKKGHIRLGEVVLEPLHHLHVEVVGRLVQKQHVRVVEKHQSECQTLHLTTRQSADFLRQVVDFEGRKQLFQPQLIRPRLHGVHLRRSLIQIHLIYKGFLITFYNSHHVGMTSRDDVFYGEIRVKLRQLFKVTDAYILVKRNLSAVGFLFPDKDSHHGAFSCTVGGNQGGLLPFLDTERDVLEQQFVAERL